MINALKNQDASPAKASFDDAPVIMLGGQTWPVPMLSAKQNRVIDPIILALLPIFSQWQGDKLAAIGRLGEAQYAALQDMTYHAIKRASPELSKDAFMELPVTLPELIAAFPVIAQQTGIFSRDDPGEA